VSDAGFSEKPSELTPPPVDDIPEAVRETVAMVGSEPRPKHRLWLWALLGFALALIANLLLRLLPASPSLDVAVPLTAIVQTELSKAAGIPPNSLLGHLPYEEAPANTLEPITSDGRIKLRKAAAEQFTSMAAAARVEGVELIPLSGFRSVADQEQVFFSLKAERRQLPTERAEVSAPPGYSEHHTGYAVDLADASRPETDLEHTFDTTPAFQWLKQNAARFNFELSFPKDNSQGVSYEPWHWRFVGDRASLETFYQARFLLPGLTKGQTP